MKSFCILPNNGQRVIWRIVSKYNGQGAFIKSQPRAVVFANLVTLGYNTLFHEVLILL
jgi:hypothetical protein